MHIMSFLECPPHLRKKLFPLHENLRAAGSLPSLDMPHHFKADEWCQYREGVTLDVGEANAFSRRSEHDHYAEDFSRKKHKKKEKRVSRHYAADEPRDLVSGEPSTFVDAGLPFLVSVPASIPPSTRVTLKFSTSHRPEPFDESITAAPVHPAAPREEAGYYWGYDIRIAASLSAVFSDSPFAADGAKSYDVTIGTSERGVHLADIVQQSGHKSSTRLPKSYKHALIVFGGVAGLEAAAVADPKLQARGISGANVEQLFDYWVNVVPGQGSRTIRTEEAVWIALGQLWEWLQSAGPGKS